MSAPADEAIRAIVLAQAKSMAAQNESDTRLSLDALTSLVRGLSASPGDRSLVLVSPGFLTPRMYGDVTAVIDGAVSAHVAINSLDARGLFTVGGYSDASRQIRSALVERDRVVYDRDEAQDQRALLAELADGTGGDCFQNNNDLLSGFKRLAVSPETYYLLAFTSGAKPDEKRHELKVSLRAPAGYSQRFRKSYLAASRTADAEERAKETIQDAVFSRAEQSDLPISVANQFFKLNDVDARLTIAVHVDIHRLRFRVEQGRQRNTLTAVAALFDRDGNLLYGKQDVLQMRLRNDTFPRRVASGVTMTSHFDVKPGIYRIRTVVRDSEGQMVSTATNMVDIP